MLDDSTTTNKTFVDNNQASDCKTEVHLGGHGGRTTMTIRIFPELKEAFTGRTRQMGLRTCHIIEGLVSGWLHGVEAKIDEVHKSPTINLTLVRDVKRVRRYAVEEVEESREVAKAEVCLLIDSFQ